MPLEVRGCFVSQKINKVRWIPEEYVETKSFFTGSWDDTCNSIKVWTYEGQDSEKDFDEPRQLSEYRIDGDVTEIKFVDKNRIAVSSSDGDVRLLEISSYEQQTPLREIFVWKKLHNYGSEQCSCTALDTAEGDVATVGDNGSVHILNCRRGEVSHSVANADSCSIQSVCYMRLNELVTGNIRGHIKVWDLRAPSDKPTASFLISGDEHAATYLVNHPTQPHIILVGSESGSVAAWDLRRDSYPASSVNVDEAAITEMQFHPENPQKMFTCSASGEVWDWNMEMMIKSTKGSGAEAMTTWAAKDNVKKDILVNRLMPRLQRTINSIHCDKSKVLCGADNEALYLIKGVNY